MQIQSETYAIVSHLAFEISIDSSLARSLGTLPEGSGNSFARSLKYLVQTSERKMAERMAKARFTHPIQQMLLDIVALGLSGHPVHQKLLQLESELYVLDRDAIERHQKLLPYRSLLPIFGLVVPGYLILLFGSIFAFMRAEGF